MKLLDYIRGLRKGKEAHRLEKESMKDGQVSQKRKASSWIQV